MDSDEPDTAAVPVPVAPLDVEPVAPPVAPVVAVLVPMLEVDEVDGFDAAAGVPVELDVVPDVVVVPPAGVVVVLLDVVPFDVAVVVSCAFVDVVVWAWSAVVPSMSSAAVTVTALDDGLCFI